MCVCVCRIELTSRCLSASAQPGKTHFTKRQNTDECSSAGRGAHIPAHTYSNIILHTRFHNQAHGRAGGGAGGGTLHWTYLFKNKNRRRLKCHSDFLPDLFFNPLWSSSTCLLLLDAEQVKCGDFPFSLFLFGLNTDVPVGGQLPTCSKVQLQKHGRFYDFFLTGWERDVTTWRHRQPAWSLPKGTWKTQTTRNKTLWSD